MNAEMLQQYIDENASFTFSRSSGPGGQNVNKVNTQVTLHIPLDAGDCLTFEEVDLIKDKLKNRVNSEGYLYLQVSQTRSREKNIQIARQRAFVLLENALQKKRKRKATRPGRRAKERRLKKKRHRSDIKKYRKPPES